MYNLTTCQVCIYELLCIYVVLVVCSVCKYMRMPVVCEVMYVL